jgi:CheY-like chemotaxis protein
MGLKIAIVKDNSFTESVVWAARDLQFPPEDIRVARNKGWALTLIREAIPDIAIVDPHLTEDLRLEDGIEVIEVIRAIEAQQKAARACYIILLTGDSPPPDDNGLKDRALAAGANAYLSTKERGNWLANLRRKIEEAIHVIQQRAVQGNTP